MDITKDTIRADGSKAPELGSVETAAQMLGIKPIGEQQIQDLMQILNKYRAGKKSVDSRIIASENWWKLRNDVEEDKDGHAKPGFRSKSGWLHNVITNKHADAMDAYPEPNILPREQGDKAEAAMLSKIIPVVLEKNQFETTYSKVMWSKLKTGTGVYKVIWDKNKMNGAQRAPRDTAAAPQPAHAAAALGAERRDRSSYDLSGAHGRAADRGACRHKTRLYLHSRQGHV